MRETVAQLRRPRIDLAQIAGAQVAKKPTLWNTWREVYHALDEAETQRKADAIQRESLNSSGLTPTAASTAVSAASDVWLRRVLLAVAAFETLVGSLFDLAVFVPDIDINARLFIHPFFAIAALVLAARRYLRAAIVVLAAYIAALAIAWSLDLAFGLSLLAQQVIFGPLAVTAIVLAILDKLLWLRFSSRCRRQTCSGA